jgi:hypothetical protein
MISYRWSAVILVVLVVGVGFLGLLIGGKRPLPLRLLSDYSWAVLAEEMDAMDECAECHETAEFHTCDTCHDDHGAIELSGVPFYAVVTFTGDVPEPGYVTIDEILPYPDQPHTHISLLDFLEAQGVTAFERVTMASDDGGFVTVARPDLTQEALLMPYEDGIRFAAENLHVSTWLKGVKRIIVVGAETPLTIDGQATSMGRLLLGPTRSVTVEETDVMLKSESDGQIRRAKTASRVEGAPIEAIVANPVFQQLAIRDQDGETHTLTAAEARGAVLILMHGRVTLALPARGRTQWISDVVEITSQAS